MRPGRIGRTGPAPTRLLLAAALSLCGVASSYAQEPSTTLSGVTVTPPTATARRIEAYVAGVTLRKENNGFAQWKEAVCPIVAGLPREQGEAALARISHTVAAAGAPLAVGKCQPNLYVVVTPDPAKFARSLKQRNPNLFGDGLAAQLREFMETDRPTRVWYQIVEVSGDATPGNSSGQMAGTNFSGIKSNARAANSRLEWSSVRAIKAAIVVIDAGRAKGLTVSQIADYGALVGLTELDLRADIGDAPTVLSLFGSNGGQAPGGLTEVDAAFLNALYHTSPKSRMQRSQIAERIQGAYSQASRQPD